MDTHIINAQEYYLAKNVKDKHKLLFKGCLSSLSKIIPRHGLTNNEYTYARHINGELVAGENKSNKVDKLYLTKEWVYTKLVELGLISNENICNPINETVEPNIEVNVEVNVDEDDGNLEILELEDHEKLADDEGNIYDIEVRGERHPDKIYFKVKDISVQLGIENLRRSITHKNSNYDEGRHYIRFYTYKNDEGRKIMTLKKKDRRKNILFLTYRGFMKLIHSASGRKCDKFLDWVTNVVYAAHLGTKSQRNDLASKVLGVDRKTLREVLSKSTTNQSCIYLIYLGKAKDLAKKFKIKGYEPNESIYKFGRSVDLTKRVDQHHAKYNKLGCEVKLAHFEPIDPIYNVNAENDIKEYFMSGGYKIDNAKYVELVKLNKDNLSIAKHKYKEISDRYMGKYTQLNNRIKIMEETCRADIAELNLEPILQS